MHAPRLTAHDRATGDEVSCYLAAAGGHVARRRHGDGGEEAQGFFDDRFKVGVVCGCGEEGCVEFLLVGLGGREGELVEEEGEAVACGVDSCCCCGGRRSVSMFDLHFLKSFVCGFLRVRFGMLC